MVQARNPSVLRMTTKTLRLRVRDEGRFCLFASRLTVDRHGLRPRDDKVKGRMWLVRLDCDLCHCEERAERGTRQSIGCNGAYGECGSLPGSQWIATGFQPSR
jgi:hypothetical protein